MPSALATNFSNFSPEPVTLAKFFSAVLRSVFCVFVGFAISDSCAIVDLSADSCAAF